VCEAVGAGVALNVRRPHPKYKRRRAEAHRR
jgi:hypothetical protein